MAEKKKQPMKKSNQQQKRDAAQAEAVRNQKVAVCNQSLDLLDEVASQVRLNREGHNELQQAVQNLRVRLVECEAYEKTIKPEEANDKESDAG